MSHPGETVTIPPTGGQTKTLIMQHPGNTALLMIPTGQGMRTEVKEFSTPCRAVRWCIANAANFYLVCLHDPEQN